MGGADVSLLQAHSIPPTSPASPTMRREPTRSISTTRSSRRLVGSAPHRRGLQGHRDGDQGCRRPHHLQLRHGRTRLRRRRLWLRLRQHPLRNNHRVARADSSGFRRGLNGPAAAGRSQTGAARHRFTRPRGRFVGLYGISGGRRRDCKELPIFRTTAADAAMYGTPWVSVKREPAAEPSLFQKLDRCQSGVASSAESETIHWLGEQSG